MLEGNIYSFFILLRWKELMTISIIMLILIDTNQWDAYQKLMEHPIPRKKKEQCSPPCPQTDFLMQHKWNQMIYCGFNCFLSLPSIAKKLSGETSTEQEEEEDLDIDECKD